MRTDIEILKDHGFRIMQSIDRSDKNYYLFAGYNCILVHPEARVAISRAKSIIRRNSRVITSETANRYMRRFGGILELSDGLGELKNSFNQKLAFIRNANQLTAQGKATKAALDALTGPTRRRYIDGEWTDDKEGSIRKELKEQLEERHNK